jgi:hypothetical protein
LLSLSVFDAGADRISATDNHGAGTNFSPSPSLAVVTPISKFKLTEPPRLHGTIRIDLIPVEHAPWMFDLKIGASLDLGC